MAEETFYDESSAIFIAKKICNVMSVSEPDACWHGSAANGDHERSS